MHQPVLVGVLQAFEDRLRDRQSTRHRQRALLPEDLGQGASLAVRHHVIDEALGLAHEVDREGMRMAELRDGARLLLESGERGRAPRDVGPQQLYGQPPLQVLVPHFVYLGEATPAKQAHDPILRPQGPGQHSAAVGRRLGGGRRVLGAQHRQTPRSAAGTGTRPVGKRRVAG